MADVIQADEEALIKAEATNTQVQAIITEDINIKLTERNTAANNRLTARLAGRVYFHHEYAIQQQHPAGLYNSAFYFYLQL